MKRLLLLAAIAASALTAALASAAGPSYSLFGDAMLVHPGNASSTAAQTRSGPTGAGYGGIDLGVPPGVTTISSLNNLSTDYMFTAGSCAAGSPRFVVEVTTPTGPGNFVVYIGPPPNYTGCPPNVWTNTGNLVTPASLVDSTHIPGGTFYDPYAHVQTAFGAYPITDVFLVTDAGYAVPGGEQTVQFDNVAVNGNSYTFEFGSKKECEKYYEQQKKDFEAQQKADKKAFEDTHPTHEQKKAFEEQQKADKKAFEDENKANREQCKDIA